MERVFVYGTLKAGNDLRGLNQFPGATFIGDATTLESEYSMYDLGAFPAVMPCGDAKVLGELWEVDEYTFGVLDQIEGYPTFYNRSVIQTTLGPAWMYYFVDRTPVDETVEPVHGLLEWT